MKSCLSFSLSVSNPCAKLSCPFLCLLNPSGASCVCPEGKTLVNRTCADSNISGTSVKTRWAECPYISNRTEERPSGASCQTRTLHLTDFDWSVFRIRGPLATRLKEWTCVLNVQYRHLVSAVWFSCCVFWSGSRSCRCKLSSFFCSVRTSRLKTDRRLNLDIEKLQYKTTKKCNLYVQIMAAQYIKMIAALILCISHYEYIN